MDVDTAGGIGKTACFAQGAYQPLQHIHILSVEQNGADQLHAVFAACGDNTSPFLALTGDAAVRHEFPGSARRRNALGVIVISLG